MRYSILHHSNDFFEYRQNKSYINYSFVNYKLHTTKGIIKHLSFIIIFHIHRCHNMHCPLSLYSRISILSYL